MTQQISIVGFAWYELEDFPRIKALMEDGHALPSTYSEWRLQAEQLERKLRREGHFVIRAPLRPDELLHWCAARGLKVNASARTQFASQIAAEKYRAIQEGPSGPQ